MSDDVPLICDPVPGPPFVLTVNRTLSKAEVEQLRQAWEAASAGSQRPRVKILAAGYRFESLVAQRTEWPDAEYYAA